MIVRREAEKLCGPRAGCIENCELGRGPLIFVWLKIQNVKNHEKIDFVCSNLDL